MSAALVTCLAAAVAALWRVRLLALRAQDSSEQIDSRIATMVAALAQANSIRFVLDVGGATRERALAELFPDKRVVTLEGNARRKRDLTMLQDSVLHVRVQQQLLGKQWIDPLLASNGNTYDLVLVSLPREHEEEEALKIAWFASAMKPGALLVMEARELSTFATLDRSELFTQLFLCKGLARGHMEAARKRQQDLIAKHANINRNNSCLMNQDSLQRAYLICGIRNTNDSKPPHRRLASTIVMDKPAVPRLRDKSGVRARAGAVVFDDSIPGQTRILLISSSKRPNEWTLPAGGVEQDENLEQAAMREVFEESGCVVHPIALLHTVRDEAKRTETHLYLARLGRETSKFLEDGHRRRIWVDLEDALALCSARFVNHEALKLARNQLLIV